MTIARRRPTILGAIAAPPPAAPAARPVGVGLGLPVTVRDVPAPEAAAPVGRLRRCTFRRIDHAAVLADRGGLADGGGLAAYEVVCLYPGEPLALGDLHAAQPFCAACTAPGIFRPDED